MANVTYDSLLESTLGINEAVDSEVQEAIAEFNRMKRYNNGRGAIDTHGNVTCDFNVIKTAIQYHARGKSLNQEVEVKLIGGEEKTVNLGRDAVKYCENWANDMEEDARGTRSVQNKDGSYTKTVDRDEDWHGKHGNEQAAKACAEAARRLARIIHKWTVQYR